MVNGWYRCSIISGWWFQTCFYFPFHIWDVILPIDEVVFFKGVGLKPPTSHFFVGEMTFLILKPCWWNTTIFHGEIAPFPIHSSRGEMAIPRNQEPSKPAPKRRCCSKAPAGSGIPMEIWRIRRSHPDVRYKNADFRTGWSPPVMSW